MRHVLEHIYYPKDLLKELLPFIADNGILYIAIPNILIPDYLNSFTYPHISHFSKGCLTYLCQCVGLKVCEIQETEDEIWCILKKNNMNKISESWVNSTTRKLRNENINQTKNHLKTFGNCSLSLKRSMTRSISHIMPSTLLNAVYDRRSKDQ